MSDWSSFDKEKNFYDSWSSYLQNTNVNENILDTIRDKYLDITSGDKRKAARKDRRRRAGKKLARTASQLRGPSPVVDTSPAADASPVADDEETLTLKDPESEITASDLDLYAGMSDEEMKAAGLSRNFSDRLQGMADKYEDDEEPDFPSPVGPPSTPPSPQTTPAAKEEPPPKKPTTTRRRETHPINQPHPSGIRFEDLSSLTGLAVQNVLRQLDKDDLVLALKGTTQDVEDLFLANVSSRAADDIREEMEIMGAIERSRIRGAQLRIIDAAVKLADSGTIYIPFYSGRKETPTEKAPTKKASTKKVKPVRGQGKTTPKAAAPGLSRAQRRQNKPKGSGTVQRAGGTRGMPTQSQSRSRRNQRENIDLTLEELIKEELLRVLDEKK